MKISKSANNSFQSLPVPLQNLHFLDPLHVLQLPVPLHAEHVTLFPDA